MKLREDVKEKGTTRRRRYSFAGVKSGSSAWVATEQERSRLLSAFKYFVQNNKNENFKANAYATSEKVDHTDPDGPGYRVFFKSRKEPIGKVTEVPEDGV